jgi:hypothetical protein
MSLTFAAELFRLLFAHIGLIAVSLARCNRGRPGSPGMPGFEEPGQATVRASGHRHRLPPVPQTPVLGGLRHEYHLATCADLCDISRT